MISPGQKELTPYTHYLAQAARMDGARAKARLGVCTGNEEIYVNLLGRGYAITCPGGAIRATDGGETPPLTAQTLLLRWLLLGSGAPHSDRWLTFRETPWGETYLPAFQGRVLRRAAFTFAPRPEAYKKAASALGTPVAQSDLGYEFPIVGSYALRLLLWEGDGEFPPSAQVLYSDNFAADFTAEDRVVAAELLISRLKAAMQE